MRPELPKHFNSHFNNYGLGLGLRPCHFGDLSQTDLPAENKPEWLEAITENYFTWDQCPTPRSLSHLLKLRKNYPLALHGVSLSLGSSDPISTNYLNSLKELVNQVQPIWISDHLCWTSHEGQNLHDLLPLPYTDEAINHVAQRILKVQDHLGSRILLENLSSYVEFESSEMQEWEFLSEIARRADCGILLDLNNVYVSSRNHGFDPLTYLENIPHERVGQIHLAGHSVVGKYLIDTHDAPICPEVWDLYRWSLRRLGPVTTMIERDKNIPALSELMTELGEARKILTAKGVADQSGHEPGREVYDRTGPASITL